MAGNQKLGNDEELEIVHSFQLQTDVANVPSFKLTRQRDTVSTLWWRIYIFTNWGGNWRRADRQIFRPQIRQVHRFAIIYYTSSSPGNEPWRPRHMCTSYYSKHWLTLLSVKKKYKMKKEKCGGGNIGAQWLWRNLVGVEDWVQINCCENSWHEGPGKSMT